MIRTSLVGRVFGVVLSALLLVGVTGCNPVEDLLEKIIEGIVQEESGSDIDISIHNGKVVLPDDFPSEVPLPDSGELVIAYGAQGYWVVGYDVETQDICTQTLQKFADDQWEEAADLPNPEGYGYMFHKGQYDVILGCVTDDGTVTLDYIVMVA